MFLFDGKVCVLLIGLDDVDFSGVVGNVKIAGILFDSYQWQ